MLCNGCASFRRRKRRIRYIHRQWDMTVHSSEMEGEPEPAPPEVTHAAEAMSEGNELQGQE